MKITKEGILNFIGMIFSVCTLLIFPYFTFYSFFFEHDDYKNRKWLKKYIKKNGLSKPDSFYTIPLPNNMYICYWEEDNNFSVHNNSKKCILSEFHNSLYDTMIYNWILKHIKTVFLNYAFTKEEINLQEDLSDKYS